MTQFLSIMPVLKVTNLNHSIDWYASVLGFRAEGLSSQDGGGENCFLRAGGTEMMLTTGTHLGEVPTFTGTIYFRVVGVNEIFARVEGQAEIVWPLAEQEYGTREFGIRDPDGYLLAFAEEITQ